MCQKQFKIFQGIFDITEHRFGNLCLLLASLEQLELRAPHINFPSVE